MGFETEGVRNEGHDPTATDETVPPLPDPLNVQVVPVQFPAPEAKLNVKLPGIPLMPPTTGLHPNPVPGVQFKVLGVAQLGIAIAEGTAELPEGFPATELAAIGTNWDKGIEGRSPREMPV